MRCHHGVEPAENYSIEEACERCAAARFRTAVIEQIKMLRAQVDDVAALLDQLLDEAKLLNRGTSQ